MTKTYNIHDNGGVPFIVDVTKDNVLVYTNDTDGDFEPVDDDFEPVKGDLVTSTPYQQVWIGDNELNDHDYLEKELGKGNSILVRITDDQYMYIGSEIYKFKTHDQDRITTYFSPIGNSDVPYPYAIGEMYAYFMLDKKIVPVNQINVKVDGYTQFYDMQYEQFPDFRDVETI